VSEVLRRFPRPKRRFRLEQQCLAAHRRGLEIPVITRQPFYLRRSPPLSGPSAQEQRRVGRDIPERRECHAPVSRPQSWHARTLLVLSCYRPDTNKGCLQGRLLGKRRRWHNSMSLREIAVTPEEHRRTFASALKPKLALT